MPSLAVERVLTATPELFGRGLVAPLQLELTDSDHLRFRWFSAVTSGTNLLILSYRILTPLGGLIIGQETVTVPNAYQFGNIDVPLRQGYLLSLAVTSDAYTQIGQTWVQAYVFVQQSKANPSDVTQDLILAPLIQGYVTSTQMVTWPGSLFVSATDSFWYRATYVVPNPGAGVNWTQAVPTERDWQPVSVDALFTASAVVQNRLPVLVYNIGSPLMNTFNTNRVPAIAANQSIRLCWARGTPHPNTLTQDAFNDALPLDITLQGGIDNIAAGCIGLDVGDTWTAIQIAVRERLALA